MVWGGARKGSEMVREKPKRLRNGPEAPTGSEMVRQKPKKGPGEAQMVWGGRGGKVSPAIVLGHNPLPFDAQRLDRLDGQCGPCLTWAAPSVLSGRSRSSDSFGLSSVSSEPSAEL